MKTLFIILLIFLQKISFSQNNSDNNYKLIMKNFENIKYSESFSLIDDLSEQKPSDSLFNIFYLLIDKYKNAAEMGENLGETLSKYIVRNPRKSLDVLENFDDNKLEILIREFTFAEGSSCKLMEYILDHYLYNKKYFKYFKKYY